jgi:3D (Asp-Asp-Asp) domain-containing protein
VNSNEKKSLRETIVLLTSSVLIFTGYCTYRYWGTRAANIELNKKLSAYIEENEKLKTTISNQDDRINTLNQYVEQNEEKYAEAEKVHTQNTQLKASNDALEEQKQGLIEFIQKKTGLKVKDIQRVNFEVTMYTNEEGAPPYEGHTASGNIASRGTVAAPKSIPMHTLVMIDGMDQPWASKGFDVINEVLDRGGAVQEKVKDGETYYRIDVWAPSKEAKEGWGRRDKEGWLIYVE